MGFKASSGAAVFAAAAVMLLAGAGLAQDQGRPGVAATPAAVSSAPAPTGPAIAAPAPSLRLAPGEPIPAAELEAFVDGVVGSAMARDHIAGAVVTVVQNGQVVLDKGYGVDRRAPARAVDPQRTLFRLGQVTRTFTWPLVMREIEDRRIRLDAPVNVYLPVKDHIPDHGFKRPVTVQDLLTHTEGFEVRTFGQLIEKNPARIRPLETYLRQERPGRVRPPGGAPADTLYGAALAGEALTQVTGKTPQALVESAITQPLGMTRTTLREPYPHRADLPAPMDPRLAADVSEGFHWTGVGYRARPFEYMTQVAPAASASSTGADMARWMLAILGDGTSEGATIYSPAIARDFRASLPAPAPGAPGWAYGFAQYPMAGGLSGQGQSGATLSFRSSLVTVPALGLGVFVAGNTDTSGPLTVELPQRIVARFYGPPASPALDGSTWLKAHAAAFAGAYLSTARAYGRLEGFIDLIGGATKVRVTSNGVLVTPGQGGPRRWLPEPGAAMDAPYVRFREVGGSATLVFEMKDRRARRWFAPSGEAAFERAGLVTRPWLMDLLAIATAAAAVAALAGLFARSRRDLRQTTAQSRADAAQLSGSVAWLTAMACFAVWKMGSSDAASLAWHWPGPWLLVASAAAVVAALMTVVCLALLPAAWRGGRRLDSWTAVRKARFTVATVIFALFALELGLLGALEPWSR